MMGELDPSQIALPPAPPASLMGGAPTAPQQASAGGWDTATPPEDTGRVGDPKTPIEDVWGLTKDLAGGIGHVVGGYYNLLTDPKARDEWKKGTSDLMSGKYHKDVGNYLWKGVKEDTASHWTDPEGNVDLGYTLWHHPASALMDLAIVKDLVSGGVKMTGKVAGGASREGLKAAELAKLGTMSKADKVVQFGEKVGKVPLDPYQLMGKAAGATPIGKSMKEALGFGAETKGLDAVAAHTEAEVNMEAAAKHEMLAKAHYGEDGAQRIFDALDRGSQVDYAALKPEERAYVDAYKASQQIPHNREKFLTERGLISEEEKADALAKQASLREFGNVEPANVEAAAGKIRAGEWQPTYRYLATEKSHEFSMLENLLHDANGSPGKVGFLEQRTGMGNYIKDPRTAAMMQIRMESQFDKKIRLFDRALDYLNQKGLLKFAKAEKDIPHGWQVIPNEIWKKYMLSEKRAAGLSWANATRGMDAVTAARDAFGKMITDPAFMGGVTSGKVVAVPKYIANWMRFRLGIPGPLARGYDTMARYWKSAATLLRPQYWINVAAGNGFLSALHGVQMGDAVRYWKNRNFLPPELRAIMQTSIGPEGATRWQKATTSLRNFDSMIHTHLTKGPGFAHEVEGIRREVQGLAKQLHEVGQKFFIGADVLEDPQKFYQLVAQSPEKLSKAIQEHVVLREQVASYIPQIRQKQAEYNRAAAELQKAQKAIVGTGYPTGPALTKFTALQDTERTLHADLAGLKEEYLTKAIQEGVVRKVTPQIDRIAGWAEKAIEPINELEGAYLRLHPLERQWVSRAVPFYPWTKAMSKLVFMLPFTYPGKTFMWNRWASMMSDLTSHEEHMPEWLQGAVPIGHTADGATAYIRPFWDPFKGEHPVTLGGVTMPGIVGDLPMRHPIFKVMHDIVGGTDSFTMKPWSTDENMTRLDNGEVYKMDAKTGQWVRAIAQPSLWRRLWGLFPQSQMIDKLFLPHVQTDRGWIGNNDPVQIGGEPIKVPFLQRLAGAVLPVSFQTEDQKNMEEGKQGRIYKDFIKEIKHLPTEEQRNTAVKVLNDALRVRK